MGIQEALSKGYEDEEEGFLVDPADGLLRLRFAGHAA
jgi:hypothetical protein